MFNASLENSLIVKDIVDTMVDYTSIQIDIDEAKVKAAALVAQRVDLKRLIGQANIDRTVDATLDADVALRDLIIPPLCYFTYARCLKMFQGTFTDSGFTTSTEADERNSAKSVANEMSSIAEAFMEAVFDFLEAENPDDENVVKDNLTPRIRVFGGEENRGSN